MPTVDPEVTVVLDRLKLVVKDLDRSVPVGAGGCRALGGRGAGADDGRQTDQGAEPGQADDEEQCEVTCWTR